MDFVSPVIDLISRLWDCCSTRATYLRKLKKNLTSLGTSLNKLKSHRNDVKRTVEDAESDLAQPKKRLQVVDNWLRSVEAFEQEVEEMLKEGTQQIKEGGGLITGCFCCCRPKNCWTGYKIGKLVVQKQDEAEKLINDGKFDVVFAIIPHTPQFVQEIPINPVTGMDSKLQEIWSLVTTQNQYRCIGFFGMGGVGKTTLLKKLHNELLNNSHDFDLVIWAVVSKDLNLGNVQKQIGKSLGFSWNPDEDLDKKAQDILRVLKHKKFVLLLDDIWQRVDLIRIGIPPLDCSTSSSTARGNTSKVLFTTRSEFVCGQMDAHKKIRVDCLAWVEAWSLFASKVGQEALNCHPEVPKLAEMVAKECDGLPLALITVGRAMASKKTAHDWRYAINILQQSAAKFQGMDDQVLAVLKFSYDNLPNDSQIKSCFLYCSLYPEDYSIKKEELIDCWIAEGFLDEFEEIDEIRTQGHHFISSLKDACLLESGVNAEEEVKMHDVVRDMAIWVASECGEKKGKYFISTSKKPKHEEWERAERISLMNHIGIGELGHKAPNCPNLLTLMLQNNENLETISDDFFQSMPVLRVLNLSHTKIEEIPVSAKLLLELQFLNLSFTHLQNIPPGVIPFFSKLKVLDVYDSNFGGWEEEGGPSLRELEGLPHLTFLGIMINNLLGLQKLVSSPKLQLCTQRLLIKNCRDLASLALSPSPTSLSLSKLKSLKELMLHNCWELKLLRISLVVEEGEITLLNTLEELIIFGSDEQDCNILWDRVLPRNNLFSTNLKYVYLVGIKCVQDLTWIIYAQGLKKLHLWDLDNLEQVVLDGFDVDYNNTFSRLETLILEVLPKLKSVCKNTLAFPCLEKIRVYKCPHLKKLPLDSNSTAKITLRSIQGKKEWWKSLEWEDEGTKSKFEPYFTEYSS